MEDTINHINLDTGTAVGGLVRAVVVGGIGAVADALAGQSAAEAVNLTAEDSYWSENYLTRPYVERDRPYADYRSAYRYGWESRARFGNRPFHEVESELGRGWDEARGVSRLVWMQAQNAAGDAWNRVGRAVARDCR